MEYTPSKKTTVGGGAAIAASSAASVSGSTSVDDHSNEFYFPRDLRKLMAFRPDHEYLDRWLRAIQMHQDDLAQARHGHGELRYRTWHLGPQYSKLLAAVLKESGEWHLYKVFTIFVFVNCTDVAQTKLREEDRRFLQEDASRQLGQVLMGQTEDGQRYGFQKDDDCRDTWRSTTDAFVLRLMDVYLVRWTYTPASIAEARLQKRRLRDPIRDIPSDPANAHSKRRRAHALDNDVLQLDSTA